MSGKVVASERASGESVGVDFAGKRGSTSIATRAMERIRRSGCGYRCKAEVKIGGCRPWTVVDSSKLRKSQGRRQCSDFELRKSIAITMYRYPSGDDGTDPTRGNRVELAWDAAKKSLKERIRKRKDALLADEPNRACEEMPFVHSVVQEAADTMPGIKTVRLGRRQAQVGRQRGSTSRVSTI